MDAAALSDVDMMAHGVKLVVSDLKEAAHWDYLRQHDPELYQRTLESSKHVQRLMKCEGPVTAEPVDGLARLPIDGGKDDEISYVLRKDIEHWDWFRVNQPQVYSQVVARDPKVSSLMNSIDREFLQVAQVTANPAVVPPLLPAPPLQDLASGDQSGHKGWHAGHKFGVLPAHGEKPEVAEVAEAPVAVPLRRHHHLAAIAPVLGAPLAAAPAAAAPEFVGAPIVGPLGAPVFAPAVAPAAPAIVGPQVVSLPQGIETPILPQSLENSNTTTAVVAPGGSGGGGNGNTFIPTPTPTQILNGNVPVPTSTPQGNTNGPAPTPTPTVIPQGNENGPSPTPTPTPAGNGNVPVPSPTPTPTPQGNENGPTPTPMPTCNGNAPSPTPTPTCNCNGSTPQGNANAPAPTPTPTGNGNGSTPQGGGDNCNGSHHEHHPGPQGGGDNCNTSHHEHHPGPQGSGETCDTGHGHDHHPGPQGGEVCDTGHDRHPGPQGNGDHGDTGHGHDHHPGPQGGEVCDTGSGHRGDRHVTGQEHGDSDHHGRTPQGTACADASRGNHGNGEHTTGQERGNGDHHTPQSNGGNCAPAAPQGEKCATAVHAHGLGRDHGLGQEHALGHEHHVRTPQGVANCAPATPQAVACADTTGHHGLGRDHLPQGLGRDHAGALGRGALGCPTGNGPEGPFSHHGLSHAAAGGSVYDHFRDRILSRSSSSIGQMGTQACAHPDQAQGNCHRDAAALTAGHGHGHGSNGGPAAAQGPGGPGFMAHANGMSTPMGGGTPICGGGMSLGMAGPMGSPMARPMGIGMGGPVAGGCAGGPAILGLGH